MGRRTLILRTALPNRRTRAYTPEIRNTDVEITQPRRSEFTRTEGKCFNRRSRGLPFRPKSLQGDLPTQLKQEYRGDVRFPEFRETLSRQRTCLKMKTSSKLLEKYQQVAHHF